MLFLYTKILVTWKNQRMENTSKWILFIEDSSGNSFVLIPIKKCLQKF